MEERVEFEDDQKEGAWYNEIKSPLSFRSR